MRCNLKSAAVLTAVSLFVVPAALQAAVSKLSQIASGGSIVSSTDQLVSVRSGTTDLLVSVGSSAVENTTAVIGDNGAGGLTIQSGQVTNTMLAGSIANAKLSNSATTVNGQTCTLGSTCTVAAAAGTLTGSTLASGVTASSLTSAAGGSFGTAAYDNTGTSGATIPLLNVANTWGARQTFHAAATATATINLPSSSGTNVTSPNSGDMWWNGTNLYFYNGSANKDLLAGGGGSSPLTTKGDLYGYSSTDARIPVGTDGQVLQADSGNALGVSWTTSPAAGAGGTDTQIQYNNMGTLAGDGNLLYDYTGKHVQIGAGTSTPFGSGSLLELGSASTYTNQLNGSLSLSGVSSSNTYAGTFTWWYDPNTSGPFLHLNYGAAAANPNIMTVDSAGNVSIGANSATTTIGTGSSDGTTITSALIDIGTGGSNTNLVGSALNLNYGVNGTVGIGAGGYNAVTIGSGTGGDSLTVNSSSVAIGIAGSTTSIGVNTSDTTNLISQYTNIGASGTRTIIGVNSGGDTLYLQPASIYIGDQSGGSAITMLQGGGGSLSIGSTGATYLIGADSSDTFTINPSTLDINSPTVNVNGNSTFTGTCSAITTATVVNGLITSCD